MKLMEISGNLVRPRGTAAVEWPTLRLILGCYLIWALSTTVLSALWLPAGIFVTALSISLQSSLQHEVIHGHPFRSKVLNMAMVFPALSLAIPYLRFRATHLAHHRETHLTDPYDDPESNYLDPGVWIKLPTAVRIVLTFNNTLLGRLLIGPLVSQGAFLISEARAIRAGDRDVLAGWLWHIPAVAIVLTWLAWVALMPLWAYALAAYAGLSILKIRTFLEHQACARASNRTVIIEDRGPLALIFLNNNFHVVHHAHPGLPWYRLPEVYFANRDRYLARNGGYVFKSYRDVFARYFFRPKDKVAHPLWPRH